MAYTGKTGSDAILRALQRICKNIVKYNVKLDAVITAAQGAGAITSVQAATCRELKAAALTYCAAFELLAEYSGFDTNP